MGKHPQTAAGGTAQRGLRVPLLLAFLSVRSRRSGDIAGEGPLACASEGWDRGRAAAEVLRDSGHPRPGLPLPWGLPWRRVGPIAGRDEAASSHTGKPHPIGNSNPVLLALLND